MARFDQNKITFEDSNNVDQYEVELVNGTELKVTHLPTGNSWKFDDDNDGTLTANALEADSYTDAQDNTITDFATLGGKVKYLQDTEPSNPSTDETWYDTNVGVLRVYDGSRWRADDVFRVQEEAVTFAESDLSIIKTDTYQILGQIELGKPPTERAEDNTSQGNTDKRGLRINPNVSGSIVRGTISQNTENATRAYLLDSSETQLASTDITSLSSGDFFELSASVAKGSTYYFVLDAEGGGYTVGEFDSPSFPYTGPTVDITEGIFGGGSVAGKPYNISSVAVIDSKPTSGTATVDFPEEDLQAYDAVTYQAEEPSSGSDASSVTCDVVDANSNVLKSDIPPNVDTDISDIDTSKNPRLRFDISRDVTSLEPAVTYAAESYFR